MIFFFYQYIGLCIRWCFQSRLLDLLCLCENNPHISSTRLDYHFALCLCLAVEASVSYSSYLAVS